jgi:Leucine-rich repeat (LRR) protein
VIIGILCCSEAIAIIITCDFKDANVGYGEIFTCEASKPPLDTTQSKVIDSAFGWPVNTDLTEIKQFYTEFVSAVQFPLNLHTVFPSLEVIRMFASRVKFLEPLDLRFLSNLKVLDLETNDLEVLQSNLFTYNPRLTQIILKKNKIKFISANVFASLRLSVLNLEENLCISEQATNEAITELRQSVERSCTAPEFLLKKNDELIKNYSGCDISLKAAITKRDNLEMANVNNVMLLTACTTEKNNLSHVQSEHQKQIQKVTKATKRCEDELKSTKSANKELDEENVELIKKQSKAVQRLAGIEANSSSCLDLNPSALEVAKMQKEIDSLRAFKEEIERERRSIRLKCHFVNWNGVYSCHSDKFRVKIDDAEIETVDGMHKASKSNYDVKQLIINSQGANANTIFLPINIGATFSRVETIIVLDSKLSSIKSDNFDNMNSLKQLNLNSNLIEDLPDDAFFYPQNLETLSIAYNRIKVLHKGTFENLKNLRHLMLNNNNIQKLPTDLFKNNQKLEFIALQDNAINSIASGLLNNLRQLSFANFENNQCINEKIIDFSKANEKFSRC